MSYNFVSFLISSRSFFDQFFWIFYLDDPIICRKKQFHFFLCNQHVSSCLVALASISSVILKSSGEKEHPFLVSDLSGKALSFLPISMMLTGFL